MTWRVSSADYRNCFLRNEEFDYLAEQHDNGWYPPLGAAVAGPESAGWTGLGGGAELGFDRILG